MSNNLIITNNKNKSTSKILREVQQEGQDFEWYPSATC